MVKDKLRLKQLIKESIIEVLNEDDDRVIKMNYYQNLIEISEEAVEKLNKINGRNFKEVLLYCDKSWNEIYRYNGEKAKGEIGTLREEFLDFSNEMESFLEELKNKDNKRYIFVLKQLQDSLRKYVPKWKLQLNKLIKLCIEVSRGNKKLHNSIFDVKAYHPKEYPMNWIYEEAIQIIERIFKHYG